MACELGNKFDLQKGPEELRGLRAFAADYPQSRRYFLCRGDARMLVDGVLCLPCEEFLTSLRPDSFPE
jgi:hypothetical protein